MTGLGRDLIHAVRSLAKAPAFTAVCVLTLGIGMAPVIAIHFGLRMFTTPPPGVDPKAPTELVELVTTRVGQRGATDKWSYPDFVALRDADAGVSVIGSAEVKQEVTLPVASGKATLKTMFVSSEYFRTIGVALARGPGFQQTPEPVAIVSHAFWQDRLGSDPDVVGKTIIVAKVPHVIAGVAADGFGGHTAHEDGVELFLPLERHPALLNHANARFDRGKTWVRIHGRLSPGVSVAQASAAVSALTSQLAREHPATNESIAGIVVPYHPIGRVEGENLPVVVALWHVLMTLPLLVVCLNVAGMVQVRSAMRERELSIRQATGASRGRLMQYLLTESVVLAVVGCSLAVLMLFNALPLVSWWVGEPIPPPLEAALQLNLRMVAECAALCLATSLVFGWLPAVRFSRPAIMLVLKDDSGTGGVRAGRFHRVTAALQVAVAVPLLIMSFMSLEQVRATAAADLGFASEVLYAAPLEVKVGADEPADSQIRRVRTTLGAAAGVVAVTVADGLPLDFRRRIARVSTQRDERVAPTVVNAHVTRVGEGYLDTMGIALARGRGFTADDAAGSAMVTIVSSSLADRLFPDADPIGQPLSFTASGGPGRAPQTLTVVGVTADFPTWQMSTEREQLLVPLAQHPDVPRESVPAEDDRGGRTTLMLVARSAAGEPPAKLTAALERVIRDVDPDFDGRRIVTGDSMRQDSVEDFMNHFALSGLSGSITLLLAALGIYGVVGLMVATRTREIAVRVALGASRPRVIAMILFDVVRFVAPGIVVGLLVTVAIVRVKGGITVSTIEPLGYVAGAAIAMLTAIAASLAPARRAASVQPMVAMRST